MHARDPADLYKDKIEVSLDGRQIFYLFFGGAVIVGLVFVLGVMVGRRVEARGHVDPARTAAAADPLAALDRLEGQGGLTFKGALTGAAAPTEVEREIAAREQARAAASPAAAAAAPAAGAAPVAAAPAPKPEKKPEPKAEKSEKAEPKAEKSEKAERAEKSEKAERAEKSEKAERAEKSEKSERAEKSEKSERSEPKEGKKKRKADGESADAGGSRFTLQLSSFQDREEADAFLASLKAAGFQAYVTETDVGGKGTFYRVRYGSYRSADAASDAKAELERVTHKNASVMRL